MMSRPNVLILSGYYDAFSSYQEVVLARALSKHAEVHVVTGNRVAPSFSDATLAGLGRPRCYSKTEEADGDVRVTRVPLVEFRSFVSSGKLISKLLRLPREPDLVILLAPGQMFSVLGAWFPRRGTRVAIFGDNSAQWTSMSRFKFLVKDVAFRMTKGLVYRRVTERCATVYANTPDTIRRLRSIAPSSSPELLPLSVGDEMFYPDEDDRSRLRTSLGIKHQTFLLGMVGRVSAEKRIELVLDALQGLGDELDWHVVVTGLGSDAVSERLRERVGSSELLGSRVCLLGFVDPATMASILRACDSCVWPVQPAITIQQAMVSGTRVIVPDNNLVGFLVEDDSQGRLLESSTVEVLEEAIKEEIRVGSSVEARRSRASKAKYLTSHETACRILRSQGFPTSSSGAGA